MCTLSWMQIWGSYEAISKITRQQMDWKGRKIRSGRAVRDCWNGLGNRKWVPETAWAKITRGSRHICGKKNQALVIEYYCLEEIKSHVASFSLISRLLSPQVLTTYVQHLVLGTGTSTMYVQHLVFQCALFHSHCFSSQYHQQAFMQVVSKVWNPGDVNLHTRQVPYENTCNLAMQN